MLSLLLHVCCANCACFTQQFLKEKNFSITGFWYNPNVQPYSEYQKRMMAAGYFASRMYMEFIWEPDYVPEDFFSCVKNNFSYGERCINCYESRLVKTAKCAKERGFRYFSTTLLYSIYQQHELIRDIGNRIAKESGVEFYYADFRQGWQQGIKISKEMQLYRQNYCGCIFSEKERNIKK